MASGELLRDSTDAAHASFVRWLLGVLAGAVVVLLALLWWLDPTSVTGRDTRFSIVVNGGIRQAKLDLMEELPEPPDVLVLGSSRSMQLDPAEITRVSGATAFNGAVSGGTSKDMYLYARYADELWGPDEYPHLVLGVVNDVLRNSGTTGLDPRLRRYLGRARTDRQPLQVAQELLQLTTLKAASRSLRHVLPRDGAGALADPTGGADQVDAGLARTGKQKNNRRDLLDARGMSQPGPEASKGTLQSRIDSQMQEYLGATFAATDTFDGVDETGLSFLRRTIALANARGDVPTVWVTPFQPDARELLPAQYEQRDARFRGAIKELLRDPDLQFEFVDFDDIASFDGDPAGFHDGIHMSTDNTARVIRALQERGALTSGGVSPAAARG